MEHLYKTNMQKTIAEFFPAYLKKELLKQAVNVGLVINNRKKTSQLSLSFADIMSINVNIDIFVILNVLKLLQQKLKNW